MRLTARARGPVRLALAVACAAAASPGCGGGHGGPAAPVVSRVLWTAASAPMTPDPDFPDWRGDSLAFQVEPSGLPGPAAIAVAGDSGTGSAYFPSSPPTGDRAPRWVGPGLVLYSSDRLGGTSDLWYLETGTGATRRLTDFPGDELTPAPRPHAPGIVYVERTGPEGGRLVLLPDTAATPLARTYLTDTTLTASEPDWSPSGDEICFAASRGTGVSHIWRLSLTDTVSVQLTTGSTADRSPRWSPDGTRILFASERGGVSGIWTVSPAGEGTELKAWAYDVSGATVLHPTWSPDGKSVLLSSDRTGVRALWILTGLGF
jgi:Tol biopolymer transport system component